MAFFWFCLYKLVLFKLPNFPFSPFLCLPHNTSKRTFMLLLGFFLFPLAIWWRAMSFEIIFLKLWGISAEVCQIPQLPPTPYKSTSRFSLNIPPCWEAELQTLLLKELLHSIHKIFPWTVKLMISLPRQKPYDTLASSEKIKEQFFLRSALPRTNRMESI